MIELNKKNQCKTTRRQLLKTTATVAGIATIFPAMSLARGKENKGTLSEHSISQIKSKNHQYIVSVLNKHAAGSKRVTPLHIDRFATGFIEMNEGIDYQKTFSGIDGEYRLVKVFIKSMNAST